MLVWLVRANHVMDFGGRLEYRIFAARVLAFLPVTADFSAWYVGNGMFAIAVVVVMSLYGFHTSIGGLSAFRVPVFVPVPKGRP